MLRLEFVDSTLFIPTAGGNETLGVGRVFVASVKWIVGRLGFSSEVLVYTPDFPFLYTRQARMLMIVEQGRPMVSLIGSGIGLRWNAIKKNR